LIYLVGVGHDEEVFECEVSIRIYMRDGWDYLSSVACFLLEVDSRV
jgi:hypothetical protein